MSYVEKVSTVVAAHRSELEADLINARELRDHVGAALADAERQVATLEGLLALALALPPAAAASERLTLHAAMRQVLENAPGGMLRAADLAKEIERRGLYRMRDGRPVEAQQIHARVGHYPDDFGRDGTFIKLI